MNREDIDNKIDGYIGLLDHCIDGYELPWQWTNDPIATYIMETCKVPENIELCQNETSKEIFHKVISSILFTILPLFDQIENECNQEMTMVKKFFAYTLEEKRKVWKETVIHLDKAFDKNVFNIIGYMSELEKKEKSMDEIFEAMKINWEKAALQRQERQVRNLLKKAKQIFEYRFLNPADKDFKITLKDKKILYKYPKLQEIVKAMGREKESHKDMDTTITQYIPILLKHSHNKQDIEGVTLGNNLNSLLPSEIAMLDSSSFYIKYARKQLQQFSSKAPQTKKEKSETKEKSPRLDQGPIILCIDTSDSMTGKPLEIAQSLTRQLAAIAQKEKRSCFLISFSIRTKTLDLSKPSSYLKLESFFEDRYHGGSEGDQMLNEIVNQLQTNQFSMADALIISDFKFELPLKMTLKKIKEEQKKGTKFYGLGIGAWPYYNDILDKVWHISKMNLR